MSHTSLSWFRYAEASFDKPWNSPHRLSTLALTASAAGVSKSLRWDSSHLVSSSHFVLLYFFFLFTLRFLAASLECHAHFIDALRNVSDYRISRFAWIPLRTWWIHALCTSDSSSWIYWREGGAHTHFQHQRHSQMHFDCWKSAECS